MKIKRAHIHVTGRVQGVFFRANTVTFCNRLGGVTGWAKNLHDGRVEVVSEGDEEKLKKLIQWLHHGEPPAVVSGVNVLWEEPTCEFSQFTVAY